MLAGWKGVDAASAEDAADDVDALIAAAVNDFVTCVSDKLTLRENAANAGLFSAAHVWRQVRGDVRGGAEQLLISIDPALESAWFQALNLKRDMLVSKYLLSNGTTHAATPGRQSSSPWRGALAWQRRRRRQRRGRHFHHVILQSETAMNDSQYGHVINLLTLGLTTLGRGSRGWSSSSSRGGSGGGGGGRRRGFRHSGARVVREVTLEYRVHYGHTDGGGGSGGCQHPPRRRPRWGCVHVEFTVTHSLKAPGFNLWP
jgi:hypothetical protein